MNKRPRKSSVRTGPLSIPEHLQPEEGRLRWVIDDLANLSKRLEQGYVPVDAKSQQYKELAASIGDISLTGRESDKTSLIRKTGKDGTVHILMYIDAENLQRHLDGVQDLVNRKAQLLKRKPRVSDGIAVERSFSEEYIDDK